MKAYEYRHVVGFEETNFLGNVYYVNPIRWQGRCRELFLKERAPGVLRQLCEGLFLVTTRCSCEYVAELAALDEVIVRMRLAELAQNRMELAFDYCRVQGGREELVARGHQQIVCMRRSEEGLVPAPVPDELREALRPYQEP